ncbi:hypothetical protein BDK51DRAFT_33565 [Blyttiomyces helicus]|uniref:Uncharacterized protein n=1 Tax=Blyttiomyces helicus TaxID=388810 RepID=A0A4P9WN31_9FUNG|nr:hypothetical protein BDK51DRAFT_33565 [Blyttiomyces helicus]|eukprot:RKO94511.1 hypothetical protein BDK51DRAFT_33565 [Blyttiomyces helicus]
MYQILYILPKLKTVFLLMTLTRIPFVQLMVFKVAENLIISVPSWIIKRTLEVAQNWKDYPLFIRADGMSEKDEMEWEFLDQQYFRKRKKIYVEMDFNNFDTEYPVTEIDPNTFYATKKHNGWEGPLPGYVRQISDEYYYKNQYGNLTNAMLLVSVATTFIAVLPINADVAKVTSGLLGASLIFLTTFNKVIKLNEKAHTFNLCSHRFMQLHSSIVEQLIFPPEKRFNAYQFEIWARKRLFKLKELSPKPIKRRVCHLFQQRFAKEVTEKIDYDIEAKGKKSENESNETYPENEIETLEVIEDNLSASSSDHGSKPQQTNQYEQYLLTRESQMNIAFKSEHDSPTPIYR